MGFRTALLDIVKWVYFIFAAIWISAMIKWILTSPDIHPRRQTPEEEVFAFECLLIMGSVLGVLYTFADDLLDIVLDQ